MEEFLTKLTEILDVEKLQASDVLADFPEWDSLSVLSAISMIHFDYGVTMTAAELRGIRTVTDLYDRIGSKSEK